MEFFGEGRLEPAAAGTGILSVSNDGTCAFVSGTMHLERFGLSRVQYGSGSTR